MVGGLTSMIIESSIFYKKYVVTAFPERQFNNQYNSLKYMVHFNELNYLNNLIITKNIDQLENALNKLFKEENKEENIESEKKTIDNQRRFFLFDDNKDYSSRLLDLVSKLI